MFHVFFTWLSHSHWNLQLKSYNQKPVSKVVLGKYYNIASICHFKEATGINNTLQKLVYQCCPISPFPEDESESAVFQPSNSGFYKQVTNLRPVKPIPKHSFLTVDQFEKNSSDSFNHLQPDHCMGTVWCLLPSVHGYSTMCIQSASAANSAFGDVFMSWGICLGRTKNSFMENSQ